MTGESGHLGTEAHLTLYRAVQEALTNVRKHSRPGRVEIFMHYGDSGAELTIEDFVDSEGPGPVPRPAPAAGGGYGLAGMRERVALLGGLVEAGPTDHGFRLRLSVPA
jgi:signal transduction histidine kinase